jgi:SET domain-containing protein
MARGWAWKLRLGETGNTGFGLFATEPLPRDETIFVVEGEVVKDEYDDRYAIGANWLSVGDRTWLDPSKENPWTFVNHSCRPNGGLAGPVTVVAMRDIAAEEELTIDYSTTEADPHWTMACRCGTPDCRRTIGSIHTLSRELFERYAPFIPPFLRGVYESSRSAGHP